MLTKLVDKIDPARPVVPRPKARRQEPLTIYQLGILMIIFMAGIGLSLVTLLLELLRSIVRKVNKPSNRGIELRERNLMEQRTPSESTHHIKLSSGSASVQGTDSNLDNTLAIFHK